MKILEVLTKSYNIKVTAVVIKLVVKAMATKFNNSKGKLEAIPGDNI